jgi:hypothetical protein
MTTTCETMTGRMSPTINPDTRAATRLGFLLAMGVVTLAPVGHLAFLLGNQLGETFVRL